MRQSSQNNRLTGKNHENILYFFDTALPEVFISAQRHTKLPFYADLVISGHGHGGIIRLPFTDGLLSVDRTFFPSYTAGLYEENGSCLFVTRGLGNSGPTFRLFNRPEVAVLTLHKG